MLKVIFTLDYEIHGNGDGCPYSLMVEPTRRMLDLFDRYGAKLTIMAEVAEILKFKEYKEGFGLDDYHYEAIADQLREAIRRGHDVQLHLHPSYFNARHQDGRWVQDWAEYNFAGLPFERLNEVVHVGKNYLEGLLKPASPAYQCVAFRAANWALSPSCNVVRALLNNGIRIDTSVFKYGRREGIVNFDYSNTPSNLVPWPADENDICRRNDASLLTEVPIYSERRWVGAFLSASRVYGAYITRKHPIQGANGYKVVTKLPQTARVKRLFANFVLPFRRHPWKADFNKCTDHQLICALERANTEHSGATTDLPFVLIGHSKLFTRYNERSLRPFLAYVASEPERFDFGTFGSFDFQGADLHNR